jgi:hypothetical protein
MRVSAELFCTVPKAPKVEVKVKVQTAAFQVKDYSEPRRGSVKNGEGEADRGHIPSPIKPIGKLGMITSYTAGVERAQT